MKEFLSSGKERRTKPNAAQGILATSAFLLFNAACNSPVNERIPSITPQPIPTPSGLVLQNCEPFGIPDWYVHKAIEYACPKIAGDPESTVNVTLRTQESGAVSIGTSKFRVEGNEATLEEEVKVPVSLPKGKIMSFQSTVDPNCAITIDNTRTNIPPKVTQACP